MASKPLYQNVLKKNPGTYVRLDLLAGRVERGERRGVVQVQERAKMENSGGKRYNTPFDIQVKSD